MTVEFLVNNSSVIAMQPPGDGLGAGDSKGASLDGAEAEGCGGGISILRFSSLSIGQKFGNMPWFLLAMADGADTGTSNSASSPKLDSFLAVGLGEPLRRHLPHNNFLVSIGTPGNRKTRGRPRRLDTLAFMSSETIMIHNILNDQINHTHLDQLEAGPKLFQQVK